MSCFSIRFRAERSSRGLMSLIGRLPNRGNMNASSIRFALCSVIEASFFSCIASHSRAIPSNVSAWASFSARLLSAGLTPSLSSRRAASRSQPSLPHLDFGIRAQRKHRLAAPVAIAPPPQFPTGRSDKQKEIVAIDQLANLCGRPGVADGRISEKFGAPHCGYLRKPQSINPR